MIFYFSGNGNSRWVAEQVAQATGDVTMDIAGFIKEQKTPPYLKPGEGVGIVFPVHSWYAPRVVVDFVRRLQVPEDAYRYAICTCGDDVGKGMQRFSRHFPLDAAWSVQMPNTYIPMFNLDPTEKALRKIDTTRGLIPGIAAAIKARKQVWQVHEGALPRFKTYVINALFVKFSVRSKPFHIEGKCISCGICVQTCPVGNINLQNGLPVWGDHCVHCMGCIHTCPKEVIQYGKVTRKRGRYQLERLLRAD